MRPITYLGRLGVGLLLATPLTLASAARGQDAFEIQVYDSETAGPGNLGMEVHANYLGGTESAGHLTFEPHVGLGDWGEIGFYLQTIIQSGWDYAGVKLRLKLRYPEKAWDVLGFAINFEVSDVPPPYEASRYASEIRPIVDLRYHRLYLSFNPIIGIEFDGALAGQPQFAPAAKASLFFLDHPGLSGAGGLEYYGLFSSAGQSNALLAAVDLASDIWDLNLGVGHGIGPDSGFIAKVIIGFHPRAGPRSASTRPGD